MASSSRARRPKIVYLLEDTALYGGVKVTLEQANLLADRGWDVTVVSPGKRPDWMELRAQFRQTSSLEPGEIPEAEILVATFWTTLVKARAVQKERGGEVLHFCQGFEGSNSHNVADHPAIHEAYAEPVPAITVAPHLARLLEKLFAKPARVVTQPLGKDFRPKWRFGPAKEPRILVVAPYEFYIKGVPTALEAIQILRQRKVAAKCIRLSQWPLSAEEKAQLEPDEFHHLLPPKAVPALLQGCDLLLAPSGPQEGFGLPALEAMACGLPVIASDIPAYQDFARPAALLAPCGDAKAFADAAESLLRHPAAWRKQRRLGLEIARKYRPERCAEALEEAIEWVISGEWKEEKASLPG